jgi:hypothetical protein
LVIASGGCTDSGIASGKRFPTSGEVMLHNPTKSKR